MESIIRRSPKEESGFVSPMLCSTIAELPTGDDWQYEVKLDGYRALTIKLGGSVALLSRNAKPLNYPNIVAAVSRLPGDSLVLDGEVVAIEEDGRPSFQALQNGVSVGRSGHICYYAFERSALGRAEC